MHTDVYRLFTAVYLSYALVIIANIMLLLYYTHMSPVEFNEKFHVCEFADRYQSNKDAIEQFLENNDICIDYVRTLRPEIRSAYLIQKLLSDEDLASIPIDRYDSKTDLLIENEHIGMILIKPEMFLHIKEVEQFLIETGIEFRKLEYYYPSKNEWLSTYGYMLNKFPNVIYTYVTQRSFGVLPIVYEHLTSSEYEHIANSRGLVLNCDDSDRAFDKLFCGKANNNFHGTIRCDVVLPSLSSIGFDDMTGYAENFDIFNYYRDNNINAIYTSFNGVHTPSDKFEKNKNINTFFKHT